MQKNHGALACCLAVAAAVAIWMCYHHGIDNLTKQKTGSSVEADKAARHGATSPDAIPADISARIGDPVFLRIFKESSELELWAKPQDEHSFILLGNWPIARWSGKLGPKLAEGDGQAPEGFYHTNRSSLNPHSKFHLSFNINFPNPYDQSLGRTGSFIMVHGGRASIGCFAMTDPVIETIYAFVEAAIDKGQTTVPIHSFPFRMTPERIAGIEPDNPWRSFWIDELLPAYQQFENTHQLPSAPLR